MIKINVLYSHQQLKIKKLVEKANEVLRQRSYSGRHPEKGRMLNCQVCGNRHRSSIICKQMYKEKNV